MDILGGPVLKRTRVKHLQNPQKPPYLFPWICLRSSERNISLYSGFKSQRIGAPLDLIAPTWTHSFFAALRMAE
jgi:hypothetical protein